MALNCPFLDHPSVTHPPCSPIATHRHGKSIYQCQVCGNITDAADNSPTPDPNTEGAGGFVWVLVWFALLLLLV